MKSIAAPDLETLREALARETSRAREQDSLAEIVLVTAGDLAREFTRRDLARRVGGTMGVRALTLEEWVREHAGPAMEKSGGRRVTAAAMNRLVARALGATPREAPGTARVFAASIQDLAQGRFTPEHLAKDAPAADELFAELSRVFRGVHDDLRAHGRFDPTREEELAALTLSSRAVSDSPAALFVFGFHDLPPSQRSLLEAARRTYDVTLFIPGPGGSGEGAASSLLDWARERGPFELFEADGASASLVTLEEPMFAEQPRVLERDPARVELVTAADDAAQVRAIARRIRDDVETGARAYDEFLIVIPPDGPASRLFRRIFARAGLPLEDRTGPSAAQTFEGRRAFLLARELSPRADDATLRALAFYAQSAPADAPPLDDEVMDDLRTNFVRARDGAEIVRAYRALHRRRFGEAPPPSVEEALAAVEEVHGASTFRPRDFAREFGAALAVVKDRADSEDRGARVLLVRLDQARSLARPVVYFPGWVSGALLATRPGDPLLPDTLRESLTTRFAHEGRGLAPKNASREESVLLLRFALECAGEQATFLWSPRSKPGGVVRLPAGLLVDLASARAGRPLDPGGRELLEYIPPQDTERARLHPLDRTDLELSMLVDPAGPGADAMIRLLAHGGSEFLSRSLEATRDRWRPARLTAHDGVLASDEAHSALHAALRIDDRVWSPTSLETLLSCPFAFFVKHALALQPPRPAHDDYDPMERGQLVHRALEFVFQSLAAEHALPLTPPALPRALQLLADTLAPERRALEGLPAATRLLRRATLESLRRDLALLFLRESAASEDARSTPIHFELHFGDKHSAATAQSVSWPLDSGRRVPLHGTIDRVDATPDGELEIVDYKSGMLPDAASGASMREDRFAVHLQLPLYAFAAGAVLGRPVTRARFLATSAGAKSKEESLTAEELAAAREETNRFLERALDCARAGWFPSLPGKKCCRSELASACGPASAARHRVKRGDPDLERHLALLGFEGEDDADEEDDA